MRSDHSRPLEKDLIASFSLVRAAKIVLQVIVFKAQPVKLAQIPGEKRCIAHGPMSRAIKNGGIVDLKSRGPILVELCFYVTIPAISPLALGETPFVGFEWHPLGVGIIFASPSQPLINGAAERLISIGQIDAVKHSIAATRKSCKTHRWRSGDARAQFDALIIRHIDISVEAAEIGHP